MTEQLPIGQARKLIGLARGVNEVDGPIAFNDHRNYPAVVLWRAGFGALLEIAEDGIMMAQEPSKDHDEPMLHPHHAKLLAPLAEWADQTNPGWRTR